MHKRQGRRRRANVALATTVGNRSTIVLLFLLVLAVLSWPMPQPVATPAASSHRGAAAPAASQRAVQAGAIRGNR
jgi:hypothetical protein